MRYVALYITTYLTYIIYAFDYYLKYRLQKISLYQKKTIKCAAKQTILIHFPLYTPSLQHTYFAPLCGVLTDYYQNEIAIISKNDRSMSVCFKKKDH